mmetsp:Transcript_22825/g.26847  ORF Transcript_22825/g.26847 Transcript_22825/m.26847 type:complete len:612 (+) Transcript_22825:54-1889(+)
MPAEPPKPPAASQDARTEPRGGTCSACAKAKVKCDKVRPKCARCIRLGIDCNEQLRGRGRPPNSLRLNQDRAISHGWPGAGRVMFDANELRPGQGFPFPLQMGGDGVVIQPTFTLIDMIQASMKSVATSIQTDPRFKDGLLGDMRKKYLAVLRWLHGVSCVANKESLCNEIAQTAASFSLTEDLASGPFEVRPGLTIEAKREVKIPAFVAALNSGGSAFLVQVMVRGASVFFCNDDMASQFINAAEAEEEHSATKDDPGSVMRRIVATRDRPAYLRAAARLLVHLPQMASETSFMAHIKGRTEGTNVLCLVQMRASFSPDGENVVMGTKLMPVPEPRPGSEGPGGGGPGGGMPQGFGGMPQFMMPFPMVPGQQGVFPSGGLPFNPALPWTWPNNMGPGGPGGPGGGGGGGDKNGGGKGGESSSSQSTNAPSGQQSILTTSVNQVSSKESGDDDEESRARKRYEANWETRRKTKKSRKEGEEEGQDQVTGGSADQQKIDSEKEGGKEGEGEGEESYEEQQKNVRRRQQQLEKQQMEQVQLHYFQQMQLQHQQQLMAMSPFGMNQMMAGNFQGGGQQGGGGGSNPNPSQATASGNLQPGSEAEKPNPPATIDV